jgi:hypothetical protein
MSQSGGLGATAWKLRSCRLFVHLHTGRVVVGGPVTGGDVALRAGQHLSVNLPKGKTVFTEDKQDDKQDRNEPQDKNNDAPIAPLPPNPSTTGHTRSVSSVPTAPAARASSQ